MVRAVSVIVGTHDVGDPLTEYRFWTGAERHSHFEWTPMCTKESESSPAVVIDRLDDDDHAAFCEAGRQAFPLAMATLVEPKDINVVAIADGNIVAGFAAELVPLANGDTMGVIRWLFTIPEFQGQGIGARLARAGFARLRDSGIDYFVTDIDGDNTSSFRIVESMGAQRVRPWQQLRLLGPRATAVGWWKLGHFFDFGHYIYAWTRDKELPDNTTDSAREWSLSLVAGALIGAVAAWRAGFSVGLVAVIAVAVIIMRHAITAGVCRIQGLKTTHRAWESGYGVSLVIALTAAVIFPLPGGTYPAGDQWRARDEVRRRGIAAFCWVIVLLLIVAGAYVALHFDVLADWRALLQSVAFVGTAYLLFDAILATAPFSCFHAKRIRDWSLPAWMLTALGAVVVIFAPVLMG